MILTPHIKSNSTSVAVPVSQSMVILYPFYKNMIICKVSNLLPFSATNVTMTITYCTLFSIKVYILGFLLFLF